MSTLTCVYHWPSCAIALCAAADRAGSTSILQPSQVELTFDVAHSPSLNDAQRQRVLIKLKNLIDAEGVLHLTAQSERSQLRNREAVTERFRLLLAQALHVPRKRQPTKPSAASQERRIESKKRRGQAKQLRKRLDDE